MEIIIECNNKECVYCNKEYCHNCKLNSLMLNEGTGKLDFCPLYMSE